MSWLDREAASFGQQVWDQLDAIARAAAAEVLAGRKLLEVAGPLGLALRAGFREVARRSPTRPIVRRELRPAPAPRPRRAVGRARTAARGS